MEEKRLIRRSAQNSSILIDEDSERNLKKLAEIPTDKTSLPLGYIEVKLDSLGKLDAPAILHFRNYLMEEILELSTVADNSEAFLPVLIKCLNRMVYEKFDCSLLHEKELEEIELTIFAHFWGSKLEGKSYYKDLTITDNEEKNKAENIGFASIPISSLKTKPILKDFKEPIKVRIEDEVIKFRLPRLKDIIDSNTFVDRLYFEEEREISDIKSAISKKEKISFENSRRLEEFEQKKALEFLKVYQSCIIIAVNDQILKTVEERVKAYSKIDLKFWSEYQKVVSEKLEFGIDPIVTFEELETGKTLTRRFSFQSLDFIPTMGLQSNSNTFVSFGD